MSFSVTILLITGENSGPNYNIYECVNGNCSSNPIGTPIEIESGQPIVITGITEGTTSLKIESIGDCNNNVIFQIQNIPTPTLTPTPTPTSESILEPTLTPTPNPTPTPTPTPNPTDCTLYEITVDQGDLDDATGNSNTSLNGAIQVTYINCDDVEQISFFYSSEFPETICVKEMTTVFLTYWKNNTELAALFSGQNNTETPCT